MILRPASPARGFGVGKTAGVVFTTLASDDAPPGIAVRFNAQLGGASDDMSRRRCPWSWVCLGPCSGVTAIVLNEGEDVFEGKVSEERSVRDRNSREMPFRLREVP